MIPSGATINNMPPPHIAIPVPHSEREYAERSLPQYEHAVEMAGGEPVRIPLDQSPAEIMKLIEGCAAVVLPGSKADVDPAKYAASKHLHTAAADASRDAVDELLLQDAYRRHKPILGICYGLQILNVHRTGTLLQHIESPVNHEAGRKVRIAHKVEVDPGSKLARIVASGAPKLAESVAARRREKFARNTTDVDCSVEAPERHALTIPVNSSHHQAADVVGDGLRVVARCPDDGIIEALEGTSPEHFVLAVQWHPERSVDDERSRGIFRALVEAAQERHEKMGGEFESA